eukprot:357877-Chlamydomonas_euryale.AAC.2
MRSFVAQTRVHARFRGTDACASDVGSLSGVQTVKPSASPRDAPGESAAGSSGCFRLCRRLRKLLSCVCGCAACLHPAAARPCLNQVQPRLH